MCPTQAATPHEGCNHHGPQTCANQRIYFLNSQHFHKVLMTRKFSQHSAFFVSCLRFCSVFCLFLYVLKILLTHAVVRNKRIRPGESAPRHHASGSFSSLLPVSPAPGARCERSLTKQKGITVKTPKRPPSTIFFVSF